MSSGDTINHRSKQSRLLVTGAAGWLGTRLLQVLHQGLDGCQHFGQGAPVRGLVLNSDEADRSRSADLDTEFVTGDVRDPVHCRRFVEGAAGGTLFHTAGVIHPRRVRDFYTINAQGTENLLREAARGDLKRAVVVSSNSPFGSNPSSQRLFDEKSGYNPYRGYGRSKMLSELAARKIAKETGLEVVIVRPPWFYGTHQPERQTTFFRMVRQGRMPLIGDGHNKRSMVFVDNLIQGLLLAGGVPQAAGRDYWIADERPYTMAEIIDTVARVMKDDFDLPVVENRIHLPNVISLVANWADAVLQGVGLYNQKLHVLSELNQSIACSVERAKVELGYRPKVSLREGMRRSIEWCLANGLSL